MAMTRCESPLKWHQHWLLSSHVRAKGAIPFHLSCFQNAGKNKELDQFMLKHRKDYVDMHRTTEHEKDKQ
ncbi:hypothetical protein YC2023_043757 [Brassica napus]